MKFCLSALIFASSLHNAKDVDKEVDEIQVEVDGSHDVILSGKLVHDEVGVKYDEATEDQGACDREHKLQCLAPHKNLMKKSAG